MRLIESPASCFNRERVSLSVCKSRLLGIRKDRSFTSCIANLHRPLDPEVEAGKVMSTTKQTKHFPYFLARDILILIIYY